MSELIIGAGREREILALFEPYQLGKEVIFGFKLWNVSIEPSSISIELRAENASSARLRLVPADQPGSEKTQSFSIRREAAALGGDGARAADALIAALRRNDRGSIWQPRSGRPRPPPERARGIALPIALTGFFAALVFVIARRRALTGVHVARRNSLSVTAPRASAPKTPSA